VPHRRRPEHKARNPVLVTWRFCLGFPNLRTPRAYAVVMTAVALARDRFGMRIVEFSIQRDHIHLILEAEDAERLGKALRALGVRLARRLSALFGPPRSRLPRALSPPDAHDAEAGPQRARVRALQLPQAPRERRRRSSGPHRRVLERSLVRRLGGRASLPARGSAAGDESADLAAPLRVEAVGPRSFV
jgi:REP element-mobilizing transposase RayT